MTTDNVDNPCAEDQKRGKGDVKCRIKYVTGNAFAHPYDIAKNKPSEKCDCGGNIKDICGDNSGGRKGRRDRSRSRSRAKRSRSRSISAKRRRSRSRSKSRDRVKFNKFHMSKFYKKGDTPPMTKVRSIASTTTVGRKKRRPRPRITD